MHIELENKPTIGNILAALRTEGVKTGDVAKQIEGISEKPLRTALKTAGYVFSNKAPKGWHYIGKEEEPLHNLIFDYVKPSNPKFTRDEVVDLMTMLQEWRMQQTIPEIQKNDAPSIHERIKHLPQDEKTRKTIVIDKAIGERLDMYCKKERVNKSDILHLALMDFLDK